MTELRNRIKDVQITEDVATEPLALQEVKDFLKVGHTDEDDLITALIPAARQLLEKQLNISIASKTLKVTLTHDGCYAMALPYGPIGEVTEAKFSYDLCDNVTISSTGFTLIGNEFKQFKGREGWWTLTYDAGYAEAPQVIKQGMLKQIAWMYENRGDVAGNGQINPDVLYMLSGYNKNAWV